MSTKRAPALSVVLAVLAGSTPAADPPEPVVLKGHAKAVTALAWAADGKALASAGDDRTIRVWDPATGKQTGTVAAIARDGYGGPAVAFTADLKTAAVNYWGEVTLFNVADGKQLARFDPLADRGQKGAFRQDVFALAFSPDGKLLATAGSRAAVGGRHGLPGGVVTIWDAATGKAVHRFDKLSTAGSSVAWSPDGKLVAAGTNGAGGELPEAGEVLVWDAAAGKAVHAFKVKPDVEQGEWASAGDVTFSPDGKQVAVPVGVGSRGAPAGLIIGDTGGTVQVWDLATGKSAPAVKGLKAAVSQVAYSADGKRLATVGGDGTVRVWEARTGAEVAAFQLGGEKARAVRFSPDGKHLAAGGDKGAVRVWAVPAAK